MRITDLEVDGFGVWSGLGLSDLSEELNVFYGPNEAGKTTLMQFVRSILYGFSPERQARYLPPVRGGRPGGSISLVAGGKTYRVSRHADESGGRGLVPVVADEVQTKRDEQALVPLVGGIDEPIFNNVFAIGLREIQELGSLTDTQAAVELYKLASGLDRVSLVDVSSDLETSRNRLLAPDGRPSQIVQLLAERQKLEAELAELSQAAPRYLALSAERQRLDADVARLKDEAARLDQQAREVALASALREPWQRRSAVETSLAALGNFDNLPPNALQRYDSLSARVTARRRRFARLNKRRRGLRRQVAELGINEALCGHASKLEALAEQQQWIASLAAGVKQLENEVAELELEREQSPSRTSTLRTDAAAPSRHALAELRSAAKALKQARARKRQLNEEIAGSDQATAQVAQRLGVVAGNQGKALKVSLSEAGELVARLRRRVQLDERLDNMSRHEAELEEQGQAHLETQMLPGWILAVLGSLFVLGCALVLLFVAGLVLPASLSGSLGWPLGLFGLVAVGAAAGAKVGLENTAARSLDNCHEQQHQLGTQIKQAREERDELDALLPRGGGPLVARLHAAEKELSRLEELLPLEAERENAARQAAAARQQQQALLDDFRTLHKRWQRLLAEQGLPANTLPRDLRSIFRQRQQARKVHELWQEKSEQLQRSRAEYQRIAGRIKQVASELGAKLIGQHPLDQLQHCLEELAEQQAKVKRRGELLQSGQLLRGRQRKLRRQANLLLRRRGLLLSAAGALDEAEFRRRAAAQAERDTLRAQLVQLVQEIATALAGRASEEIVAGWLASPLGLEQLAAQIAEREHTIGRQLSEALERRGEIGQQQKTLAEDRRPAEKQLELDVVVSRLQAAIQRWRVLTTCGTMLEAIRQYYEREHQPLALREASGYLERLTAGRYTRVWTPLGKSALKVDDSESHTLGVEVLSRGTREQLFLALRLALVKSFARRGVHLPLVLDDVLVNFDVGRARAAAQVLRDFSREGHQILIFTCHEHISKLFKNIKAEVRHLPDNGGGFSPSEEEPPRKPRRKEAPAAETTDSELALEPLPEEEEIAEVEQLAPLPEPVAAPPPPPPVPKPAAPRRTPPATERVRWSAEEFEGELSDRVRRALSWEEERGFDEGSLEAVSYENIRWA